MKINNKGVTIVELLVSLALLSVVLMFLYNLLSNVTFEKNTDFIANSNQANRIDIINTIENDLILDNNIEIDKNQTTENILVLKGTKTYKIMITENTLAYYVNNSIQNTWKIKGGKLGKINCENSKGGTNTVNNAIDNLVNMRKQEGEKISCDLLQRLEYVENKTMEISAKSTGLIEEYVVKLEERIKELLKTEEIDKTRIAQEVVIYADKCSVQEEVTRLKSHIGQFRNLINTDQAVGKKLDFLIQEMNRETNTIGSKANNLEITNNVIDIKTELENIREQIQNIE